MVDTAQENDDSASQQERRAAGQLEGAVQVRGEDVEMAAGSQGSPRNHQSDAVMEDDTSDQKSKFQFSKNDADMSMHVDHPQTDVKPEVTDSGSKERPEGKFNYIILTEITLFTQSAGGLGSCLFSQRHKKEHRCPSFYFLAKHPYFNYFNLRHSFTIEILIINI